MIERNIMSTLPIKNENGFYEIRLESIGGLGANLAGKMLAEAGVLGQGFNGINFASYGSEKKGTPVKSFIRFADATKEIRDHSPIERPHVIGVFHESLYQTVDVIKGLREDGIVVVNSSRNIDEVAKDLQLTNGTLAIVDATNIAVEENSRINTVMLGALYRVIDFLDADYMKQVIQQTFSSKYPHLIESNLRSFERGCEEVNIQTYTCSETSSKPVTKKQSLRLGYETQPLGGIITAQANSIQKNMSGSRVGFLPEIDISKCIHCAQCDIVCPDLCFVWEEGVDKKGRTQMFLKGIDYQYCKGCLKCVEACPTNAISSLREMIGYAEEHRVPQKFPYLKKEVSTSGN